MRLTEDEMWQRLQAAAREALTRAYCPYSNYPVGAAGMTDEDRDHVRTRGIGITNLVRRATARADELTATELRDGGVRLRATVRDTRPEVIAVAGITAYRSAFGMRGARVGEQAEPFEGSRLWVVPNPSGLNAHETVTSLALAYADPARAAGVIR